MATTADPKQQRGTSTAPDGPGLSGVPAPEPVSPVDGELVTGDQVTFSWYPAAGSIEYWLQVALDPEFDDLLVDGSAGEATTVNVSAGFPQGAEEIYWRVRSRSGAGWGVYGACQQASLQTTSGARAEAEASSHVVERPDLKEDMGPIGGLLGTAAAEAGAEMTHAERFHAKEVAEGVEHEGVAATQIFYIAFWIVLILVSAIVALYQMIRLTREGTVQAVSREVQYPELRDADLRATELLNNYGVDPVTGAYRIPIDHAMDLMAAEAQRRGQAPAAAPAPVTGVPPAGAAAPR